jgi:hypothetical protein
MLIGIKAFTRRDCACFRLLTAMTKSCCKGAAKETLMARPWPFALKNKDVEAAAPFHEFRNFVPPFP